MVGPKQRSRCLLTILYQRRQASDESIQSNDPTKLSTSFGLSEFSPNRRLETAIWRTPRNRMNGVDTWIVPKISESPVAFGHCFVFLLQVKEIAQGAKSRLIRLPSGTGWEESELNWSFSTSLVLAGIRTTVHPMPLDSSVLRTDTDKMVHAENAQYQSRENDSRRQNIRKRVVEQKPFSSTVCSDL